MIFIFFTINLLLGGFVSFTDTVHSANILVIHKDVVVARMSVYLGCYIRTIELESRWILTHSNNI